MCRWKSWTILDGSSRKVNPGALIAFMDNSYVEGSSTPVARRDARGKRLSDAPPRRRQHARGAEEFPDASELIQRASRHGWGANVELLEYYWLLTWWAPK
jgi:hypothetical protein